MKDPLEYTEEELLQLSTDELKALSRISESEKSKFNTLQLVSKTLINGLYGAMANQHFVLFNEDMAAAITGNGRYFIRKLASYIESELQRLLNSDSPYIVAGDTDSVYFTIAPFMEKYQEKNPGLSINEYVDWADSFEIKIIQPIIQKTIDDFSRELNAHNKDIMGVAREIIADSAYYLAKKKYFARVRDSEGTRYPENDPYIKAMGVELIKSSTPKWAQKYLKEAIPHILDKDESELKNWVNVIKQEYINTDLNQIAAVGGVSRLDYDLLKDKGVPIGSRAAIRHNQYIKENGLENKYAPVQPGDKCKKLFLMTPNKFNTEIIAYTNDQFVNEVKDIIDFDTNFQKTFLSPLELMTDALGYNLTKETAELDDW